MLRIVLFLPLTVSLRLTIYNNARFEPADRHFELNTTQGVNSPSACACLCFNHTMCLTASYSGIDRLCTLFFATLNQGQVFAVPTSRGASAMSFKNKTLPGE